MKRSLRITGIAIVLVTLIASVSFAESLSKIAVIDIERIFESFPEQSRVFQRIDDLRNDYDAWMAERDQQLDDVELQIIDAKEAGDEVELARLEQMKTDILENRRTYHEIMTRRIQDAYQEIAEGEGIVQEILRAIEYVAIDEGYSAVLDASDSRIWWYSQEIDITDLVISRLRAMSMAR
jgi:outer membrane protein